MRGIQGNPMEYMEIQGIHGNSGNTWIFRENIDIWGNKNNIVKYRIRKDVFIFEG
jgi:hypothetical protein